MVFWNKLIQDIHNNTFVPLHQEQISKKNTLHDKTGHQNRKKHRYQLGNRYPNLYLTFREAQCVMHMMQGNTMKETADALALSPRTVEFYIKKIKEKLNCRTKQAVIDKILKSNFAHQPFDQNLMTSSKEEKMRAKMNHKRDRQ